MQAVFYEGPGIMRTGDAPMPAPGEGEALLRSVRVGICGTDLHIFQGHFGSRTPPGSVIGHETLAEVVEAPAVSGFRAGERVVVDPVVACGSCRACRMGARHVCSNLKLLGVDAPGGLQEYWLAPADNLLRVPASLADDDAALLEPLAVASHDVARAGVGSGDRVLVVGGGPIGALIALLCRHKGAGVLVAELNPFRLELIASLELETIGPDEEIGQRVERWTGGEGVDVAFEVSGSAVGVEAAVAAVRVRGTISVIAIHAEPRPVDLRRMFLRELTMVASRLYTREAWREAINLAASGRLALSPLVTAKVGLEGVQAAMERALAGDPMMKVLVEFGE